MSEDTPMVEVCAERMGEDGRGIGIVGVLEVHVVDLLPGECAKVQIEHRSPHGAKAWGHVLERTGPLSAARTEAACPAFGVCGGCAWQSLSYQAQRQEKQARVQRAMALLEHPPEVALPMPAPSPLRYRNKGKYVFGMQEGRLILGAYRPRTHEVVSTLGCQVVEPAIDDVACALQGLASEQAVPVHREDGSGLRYAIMRSNKKGEVLVTLVCRGTTSDHHMSGLAEALQQIPAVVGVLRCNNDLKSGALLTNDISPLCGATTVQEELFGFPIPLGPQAFWQVHRSQARRAYQAIVDAIEKRPHSRVLELYAGVGGIAFALAQSGHQVLGIDNNSEAVALASQVALTQGLDTSLEFRCEDATQLPASFFEGIHALVLDPPRKGLREGAQRIAATKIESIAYLSCGPESLAKDLAVLTQNGYQLESLQLFDFMPGTAQVECLAILRRRLVASDTQTPPRSLQAPPEV